MSKSGLADSPFFAPAPPKNVDPLSATPTETESVASSTNQMETLKQTSPTRAKPQRTDSNKPDDDTTAPSNQESLHASNNASMQALLPESIIETIRKAVKDVGKDSATYRFTPEEKKALLELGFSFKMQGYKTSENELIRIAINFILEDQRLHGRTSVLQRVLEALNK